MDMNMPAIRTASGTTQCAISVDGAAGAAALTGGEAGAAPDLGPAALGPAPFDGPVRTVGDDTSATGAAPVSTEVADTGPAVSVLTRGGS
ncbi:hypothetical protein GCM10022236_37800 [Microlunatus ginsengisoli]|uniref:Uncharacterized protein n=1 Tax=Microlunatus ginsengisoli TaxID=363863 RepID=A0ABP7AFX9_9ACTN